MEDNSNPTHATRILAILQERGDQGVTNIELNHRVCFRYSARFYELKQKGWIIEKVKVKGSVFRYFLRGRKAAKPVVLRPKPRPKPKARLQQLCLV